jgi:hypothetical protein
MGQDDGCKPDERAAREDAAGIVLSERDSARVLELLENPPKPTPALDAAAKRRTLRERLRPLQDRVAARPATGLEADKAFFDELSGDA